MVYSNALYFASHSDKLIEDVLSTFNEKQESQKNTKQDKIKLAKILFALHGKEHLHKIEK